MRTNPYYAKTMKERGVTVDNLEIVENFFIPTEQDIKRITDVLADCDTIVDIGSGYGLLLNSIAKMNPDKHFLGIDTMCYDKKFKLPKAEENVKFKFTGIEAMTCERFNKNIKRYDCVMCCWMPEGSDWRELFSKIADKKVILILSKYFSTAIPETYTGMNSFGYMLEKVWNSNDSLIQIWKK